MTETTEEVLRRQADAAAFEREQRTSASQSTVLDTAFDADTEAGTPPIKLLPAGKYTAAITSATVGPTKNGRGTMVNLTWSISEGDFAKRLLFQNILIEHDNEDARRIGRAKFKDVCSSCGVNGQVSNLDVLLYKDCLISVAIRTDKNGEYPDRNEVKNILPVPQWTTPSTAQSLAAASATPQAFVASKELPDDVIPF